MMAFLTLLLAAAGAATPAPSGALGEWTVNGARLELKAEGDKLVGRLSGEGGPCPLAAGSEVFRGALLDDNISATVRLCLLAPSCGADPGTALAILLVTRNLTGGVYSSAACAGGVKSLVLRRPGQGSQVTMAPVAGERLSKTPVPQSGAGKAQVRLPPDAVAGRTSIAAELVAPGMIAGRPVGGPHAKGYDPRDARTTGTQGDEAGRALRRGLGLLQRGLFERARKSFREAVQADPKRAEAYNGVGVTYYARTDLAEALAWYKKALDVDPGFGDAYYNMACAYALDGHQELALRYLKLAALNHYSEREQFEQDPDLTSLHATPEWKALLAQLPQAPRRTRSHP